MKTDIDIKDDIYMMMKNTELADELTGVISKTERPLNSKMEDAVISVLASRNGQIQEAIVNVNIYIKDIKRNGQYEEDSVRLRTICNLAKSLFDGHPHNDSYRVVLTEQRVYKAEGEHFVNNRLMYLQSNY